jgi:hypothetical protein
MVVVVIFFDFEKNCILSIETIETFETKFFFEKKVVGFLFFEFCSLKYLSNAFKHNKNSAIKTR